MARAKPTTNGIYVDVLVREGCSFSARVLEELDHICRSLPNIFLNVSNEGDPEPCRKSFAGITPSIWVNGKLWYLGSFNAARFENKLRTLSMQLS